MGLDHQRYLPTFVTISDAKTTDIEAGRGMDFPTNSIVVCVRGYNDDGWCKRVINKDIFLVTRLKRNANYRMGECFTVTGKSTFAEIN